MNEYNKISLTRYISTICALYGIEKPHMADEPVQWVVDAMNDICKETFDRVFIFNPDCCAQWMYRKYPQTLYPVLKNTQFTIPFRTVMPSVTPVCFGTMYTGALPEVHGIQQYEKPVIKIDSFFDSLIRAGKKPAIVSQTKASMTHIFKERNMDYYICECESEIIEKTKELIFADEHDVIVTYTYEYDSMDHKFGPESKQAMLALYQQSNEFDELVSDIHRTWTNHNTLVSFSTDHGCHPVEPCEANKFHLGVHGSDSHLDLNILHFLGSVLRKKD